MEIPVKEIDESVAQALQSQLRDGAMSPAELMEGVRGELERDLSRSEYKTVLARMMDRGEVDLNDEMKIRLG